MAQFIGRSASYRDSEYHDLRSRTSQEAYKYNMTKFKPQQCPDALPYTCYFNEGYDKVASHKIRVGEGLTRVRGDDRPSTQLVGPSVSQKGNGDMKSTDTGTRLRTGHQEVLRGSVRDYTKLQGPAPYMNGQRPWTAFNATVQPGRSKYEYSIQDTSEYLMQYPVDTVGHVEPFVRGGASTRLCLDIVDT